MVIGAFVGPKVGPLEGLKVGGLVSAIVGTAVVGAEVVGYDVG